MPWLIGAGVELESPMVTNYPGECCTGETKVVRWAGEEDSVGDCVEGCREVQEDQNTDVARICSNEEVVGDLDEGRFCAMACPETRLKGFIELMVGHVLLELGSNCPFQDFAKERKVGDWLAAIEKAAHSNEVTISTGSCLTRMSAGCMTASPPPWPLERGFWM